MPRKPRFFLPGVPAHIVQRGHNRDAVFFEDADYQEYLRILGEARIKYDCAVHAYCLMTNHIHLLVTPVDKDGISRLMQYLGRHYVPYINHKYAMSGSIWEGRYKASLIDAEAYLLSCMRYIELNPVAADMVRHASEYQWSSYACNANGKTDALVKPHDLYLRLGQGDEARAAYRALFSAHQDRLDADAEEIRTASITGTPVGSDRFKAQIERVLGQKVGQARRGRPAGYKMSEDSKKAIGRAIFESHTRRRDRDQAL